MQPKNRLDDYFEQREKREEERRAEKQRRIKKGQEHEPGFKPGHRYPIDHNKCVALETRIAQDLNIDLTIDRARQTRYEGGRVWLLWARDLRRITVTMMEENRHVIDKIEVSDDADAGAPRPVR